MPAGLAGGSCERRMASLTRRAMLRLMGAGSALLALAVAGGCLVRDRVNPPGGSGNRSPGSGGMMGPGMMGSATQADMNTYMEMFDRHTEFRRTVEDIPGGVRTTTETDDPKLRAQLQAHVSSMYGHLAQSAEVTCMSQSLPTLFRSSAGYDRHLHFTSKGLTVSETSADPAITQAIREHAQEVSGFVRDGMPAMMRGMMSGG